MFHLHHRSAHCVRILVCLCTELLLVISLFCSCGNRGLVELKLCQILTTMHEPQNQPPPLVQQSERNRALHLPMNAMDGKGSVQGQI